MATTHDGGAIRSICFLSPHSDPLGRIGDPDTGGQCVYERELARALTQLAPTISVDVYTRWYAPKPREEQISDRARVIRIPCGGDGFIRKEDLDPYLSEFAERVRTFAAAEGRSYDVVHGHYWDGGAASLLLLPVWQTPFVFTSHSLGKVKQRDLPDEATYHYSIRVPYEIEAMQRAQRVIALSRVEVGYLRDLYGIDEATVRIVPGGVDVEFFTPQGDPKELRRTLGMGDEDAIVLALGRLDPRKGFPYLLAAAPAVIERVQAAGRSVRFFLSAGGREPLSPEERDEQQRIHDAIAAGSIAPHVTLAAKLDLTRVPAYYSACDVFAVPSPYEPFGLVIVEAMACGAPVIATDQGGPVEIITEGQDGYLVHPQQTALLAERISTVLLDDDLREQMRVNARTKAVNEFAWPAIAQRVLDQYVEIAGQGAHHG